jgi:hypothetical protein
MAEAHMLSMFQDQISELKGELGVFKKLKVLMPDV